MYLFVTVKGKLEGFQGVAHEKECLSVGQVRHNKGHRTPTPFKMEASVSE
jgi:hypothetical protein